MFDDSLDNLKKNLGNKKIIEISLNGKAKPREENVEKELQMPGIGLLDSSDASTLRLEVDVDMMPINVFIAELGMKFPFTDISIKELPMEKIITHIYTES